MIKNLDNDMGAKGALKKMHDDFIDHRIGHVKRQMFGSLQEAYDRLRARARREGRQGELSPELADPAPGPEEEVLRRERAEALRRVLNTLKAADLRLFYRKYYYLQPTDRIAAELGTTPRAVEGRLYRIRKRLQEQLGGDAL